MVRACLTALPRPSRVAAYRVSRVTPTAHGSGVAEASRKRTSETQAD